MKAKRPVLSARLRMALIERRVGREARWRAVRALRRLEPQHECSEFRASYETLGCWVFSVCGSEFQVDLRDMPSKWGCYHSTGREYEYPLQADADELEESGVSLRTGWFATEAAARAHLHALLEEQATGRK